MITRSGIEVAMDAEPERPVVRVGLRDEPEVRRDRESGAAGHESGRALELRVHHVQTHVEVLGDVPLSPRADPPGIPVEVAPVGDSAAGAEAAENAARSAAKVDGRVATIE